MNQGYNVILIGIDTLRADHLGIYGYERNTSPTIDQFAKESVVFGNCFSQAPLTSPSFMSMMTSLYPTYHGVTSVIGGVGRNGRVYTLDKKIPTLAEILKYHGYSTGAFTDGGNLYDKLGFGKGFDFYSMNLRVRGDKVALIQEKDVFYWIKENLNNKFFLFFHTYAVHEPWMMPQSYLNLFSRGYTGKVAINKDFYKTLRAEKIFPRQYLFKIANTLDPDDLKYLKAIYDGSIRYVDDFMKNLLSLLAELKLTDRTIIVFTSDHGEEFMEHGMLSHKQFYNELLRVPLIMRSPALPSSLAVSQLVRNIDIFPTILNQLGINIAAPIHGTSLIGAPTNDLNLQTIAETEGGGFSIQTKKYKYIYPRYKDYKIREDELYDLDNDPEEKNNIALQNLDLVGDMLAAYNDELHHRISLKHPKRGVAYSPHKRTE